MTRLRSFLPVTAFVLVSAQASHPQTPNADSLYAGIEFRTIGPAFMSGRIADIATDPGDPNTWYVAVGSGGVWKTVNAATTWNPIFDDQSSYSIGAVTIDPSNTNVIWVGTGENVGGRHVGFGDGIYRSDDGGQSWVNKGLPASEHISKIIVHPGNSDVLWVAAQGPLWQSGGDRGLYKSVDGGESWIRTLGDAEWVGVTDILIDPRNPDRLYAATWQRHRTVAAYLGGGPGSGIHRSEDGGETWVELTDGLPESNMGKIGLAISPQRPDVVYAAIELDRRTGGVFRSTDRGATWVKKSATVSGATGPHYYQELYASPHKFDRIYLADTQMQISEDGGATFRRMNESDKHVDNHALAFRADDPDYLLVGTDGGLYESFDLGENWRFVSNLPVTQFYKLALDDAEPFYNIYGGTQDNSTQRGPSRTDNLHGIQNSDWMVVLNWDGHQPATEPGNPNIAYAERQQGRLSRLDMKTGEVVDIQPQPAADEDFERFNWDAPIYVSRHDPSRIYFASHRVWRSDDRGDTWTAVSGDLTRSQERLALPIMGRVQSWDNAWDLLAMSTYNTITSLGESPLDEGVLYAGTDDGLLQVTEDGGATWRAIEVGTLPGVPDGAFVNDVKADLFDANVVYVALDHHKSGDFAPYLLKSSDRGRTWESLSTGLPDRHIVWRVVQDHVDPGLLFAATEFGVFFTNDGGGTWNKFTGGVPTISFRDLAIHRRDDDLVAASFGRGFYILDDLAPLRHISEETFETEATLFPTRAARWYVPRSQLSFDDMRGSQGDAHFVAPNPPFGAVFTYYLNDDSLKTLREMRRDREEGIEAGAGIPFPGWDALETETRQPDPKIWLTVGDAEGTVVRRIEGPVSAGFHRVAWDLRYPAPQAVRVAEEASGSQSRGLMVAPGSYSVELSKQVNGVVTTLSEPVTFEVVAMKEGSLTGASAAEVASFWRLYEDAAGDLSAVRVSLAAALSRSDALATALAKTPTAPAGLDKRLFELKQRLHRVDSRVSGSAPRREIGEKTKPTIGDRLFSVSLGVDHSTYGPTPTHREALRIATGDLGEVKADLGSAFTEANAIAESIRAAGGPWVEGGSPPD